MLQYTTEHQRYLHGFENNILGIGHLNVEGHNVVGELIAEKLCESL